MNKDIHIGITGGTGLVGAHLIQELLDQGYTSITALKRAHSPISARHAQSKHIHWVEGDILDIPSLEKAFNQVDVIFHCAGLVSFRSSDKNKLKKINIEGTRNVVNLSIDFNIKKFIFLSSVAAVGRPVNEDTIIDEETKWEDSYRNSPYALSKRQAELEVWRGQSEGLSTVIFNPSTILGSGFWEQGSGALIPSFLKASMYPEGSNGFVAVEDVVAFLIKGLEWNGQGERFILSAGDFSYQELIHQVRSAAQKKELTRRFRSSWVPYVIPILPILRPFLGAGSIIHRHSLIISSTHSKYDGTKARDTFGHPYRSIPDYVRKITLEFLKSSNTSSV